MSYDLIRNRYGNFKVKRKAKQEEVVGCVQTMFRRLEYSRQ